MALISHPPKPDGEAALAASGEVETPGRLAVVTGASRGFGAAVVTALNAAGWSVVATTRADVDNGHAAPDTNIRWVRWDVTNDDTTALTAAVADRPVDLLINNAGRGYPGAALSQVQVTNLLEVMDVNVGGVLRACQALLPHLMAASAPLVVNVSSRLASLSDQTEGRYAGFGTSYAYRISKAAQNMTTIALAAELGPHISVIALHPGELATAMGRMTPGPSLRRQRTNSYPSSEPTSTRRPSSEPTASPSRGSCVI